MNKLLSSYHNINILIPGWFIRTFIILLWLLTTLSLFFIDEKNIHIPILLLFFANAFLYLVVSSRIVLLVHYPLNRMLPNYFNQLKQSIAIILLVSLLPTLVLLPHLTLWLSAIAILIFMAIIFVSMVYSPMFYWLFVVLVLSPASIKVFMLPIPDLDYLTIIAFFAPLMAWWAYYLLNRLETFKANEKHLAKIMALANVSIKQTIVSVDSTPLKSKHKLWQWMINGNFSYFKKLIQSGKKISNSQKISLSCQSTATLGHFTYLFWILAVIVFSIIASQLPLAMQHFLIPMMIIFPAMLVGTGTITTFQVINNNKSLLKRLSVMPTFSNPASFTHAFLSFIVSNQLKLYIFISLIIGIFAFSFHHVTLMMYLNILISSLALCVLNLAIMLWSWSSKKQKGNSDIWLMIVVFISFIVFLFEVSSNADIILWQSPLFLGLMISCGGLFMLSYQRSLKNLFCF